MRHVLETITPAKAKRYLAKNTANRRVRSTWVARLASVIESGAWVITHHGIAFDEHGDLADGQHRLLAIVKANRTVKMWVAYDVPRDAVMAIDQGVIRNVPDIAGPLLGTDHKITNDMVAVARAMYTSVAAVGFNSYLTNTQVLRYFMRHEEAIAFACDCIKAHTVRNACLRAPVARAWYSVDRDRLAEFGEVMNTGMITGDRDRAAVLLRDHYITNRNTFNGAGGRSLLYRKAECAMRAFMAGRSISKLYTVETELYTIPGDEEATVDGSSSDLFTLSGDDNRRVRETRGGHQQAWAARPDRHS